MGKISSTIELQDNFTNVLYQVMDSVNMCISATADLSSAMNQPVDTAAMQRATLSVDGARDALNHAYTAAQRLDSAMQSISSPKISVPEISQSEPAGWQSYKGIEVFTNTGIERFELELASVNSMMDTLHDKQFEITMESNDTAILSPDAAYDIKAAESRVQSLINLIKQTEDTSIDAGTDTANSNLEKLRAALSETISLENNLKEAMNGTDLSQVNSAYLQLSQNISNTERLVRDSFSSPVEIPVTWKTDNLEVFTGTGVERFRQEVQSANSMLDTLGTTQSRIASAASQMNIFPPSAIAGMNNMGNRLQAIQQRIRQIESNPLNMGTEAANSELEQLRSQLSRALHEQQNLNNAVDEMDVSAANEAYLRLSQTIGGTERYIRDNVSEQGRFNQQIDEGTQKSGELAGMIKKAVGAYATFQTLGKVIDLSDTMAQTSARLNLIVDDGGSVDELQDKIYLSAQRSRAAYQSTADAIAKMGSNAGDAFSSNDELIAFMEQVNKQFTIAGTDAQGIDAAMLQLTQSMGSGVLRGEEYNSVLEQAPNIIQSIADYMEVPKGQLKDMAADGEITADIVKNAMFAAADETNAKFKSMPMTFSQVWTSFQNTALMAFQPVLNKFNEIANSDSFQQFVNNAIEGLTVLAGVALEIFDSLTSIASTVADNWSWLSPIIYGVAAALAVYYGWQLAVNMINAISNGIHVAMAAAQMIHAAATGALTAATAAEIAAQNGLNAALYACPIVWIIILVIALVALFYAVIAAINKFAGTSISATGIICGVFMTAVAFIWNRFAALINFVVDGFVRTWNFIAAFANFFANVFNDPIGSIARLFSDLVNNILSLLESLASAIDTIFGSNLAGAVSGWQNSLEEWVDEKYGQGKEIMAKINAEDYHLDRFSYKGAWDKGYNFGEGIEDKISNFNPSDLFNSNVPDPGDYAQQGDFSSEGSGIDNYDDIDSGVGDIADNTADIADDMDITEEELKYLRDIAEQETVNRFTTAEINIEQTNHNNISSEMDLDGIVSGLTDAVKEATSIAAEGVHV